MPQTLDSTIFVGISLPKNQSTLAAASTLHPDRDNTLLLNEYIDKDEQEDITNTPGAKYTRYVNVDGLENTAFEVYVRVSNSFTWDHRYLYVRISIDGKELSYTKRLSKSSLVTKIGKEYYTPDGGSWSTQKFMFGKLEIVDRNINLPAQLTKEMAAKMGEITVSMYRTDGTVSRTIIQQANHRNMEAITQIDEKKIKGLGITHGVQFGPSQPTSSHPPYGRPRYPRKWIDTSEKPFATFHYIYRSKSTLQSLCILPEDPDEQNIRLNDSPASSSESRKEPEHGRDRKRIKLENSPAPSITRSKEAPKYNRGEKNIESKDSHTSSSKKAPKRGYVDLTLDDD